MQACFEYYMYFKENWKIQGKDFVHGFRLLRKQRECISESQWITTTEEEQSSLKRLEETIPEFFQCALVRQMGIDLFI